MYSFCECNNFTHDQQANDSKLGHIVNLCLNMMVPLNVRIHASTNTGIVAPHLTWYLSKVGAFDQFRAYFTFQWVIGDVWQPQGYRKRASLSPVIYACFIVRRFKQTCLLGRDEGTAFQC